MLYFHIPFCAQKCSYCNFHFSTSLQQMEPMVQGLISELEQRRGELENPHIETLYFGGGTPSLLSSKDLGRIVDAVEKQYVLDPHLEFTLEANPDDLSAGYLRELKEIGVNRLSVGTQSFFEKDLRLMNRAHSASQAEDSIKRAQDMGITNISLDLIYGSPGTELGEWRKNLEKAVALGVVHISSYAMTVEPRTALHHWVETGKVPAPKEKVQAQAFDYVHEYLSSQGFEHYEISNFALPGKRSRHNTAYWGSRPYLGIGPSAHSFDGGRKRSWNIANNALYLKHLHEPAVRMESEILSDSERYNERIMVGLRTLEGVDVQTLAPLLNESMEAHFKRESEKKLQQGLLVAKGRFLSVPVAHWFLSDGIASDLFYLET